MKELYTPEAAQRWTRKARNLLTAILAIGGVALIICILLCCLVNTANASLLCGLVIGTSTIAGWTIILLLILAYLPARAEAAHITGVMQGEPEELCGTLKVNPQKWIIPHSVTFYKATLTQEEGSRSLNLDAALIRELPPQGARVRLTTVRKFITAYEVEDEAD